MRWKRTKTMNKMKIYEYGSVPLREAGSFIDGGRYVTSSGDLMEWNGEEQNFVMYKESPLDETYAENTMENLTEVQLKLFWKLCK